jgi:hypothetical protein
MAPSFFQSSENVQLIDTHDGSQNWDPLNLIFPVYFDLMRRYPSIPPDDGRAVFLH